MGCIQEPLLLINGIVFAVKKSAYKLNFESNGMYSVKRKMQYVNILGRTWLICATDESINSMNHDWEIELISD